MLNTIGRLILKCSGFSKMQNPCRCSLHPLSLNKHAEHHEINAKLLEKKLSSQCWLTRQTELDYKSYR